MAKEPGLQRSSADSCRIPDHRIVPSRSPLLLAREVFHALALETKLRIYCLQQFYSLSDPGAEEALINSEAMRRFAGIRLAEDPIPDESTCAAPDFSSNWI